MKFKTRDNNFSFFQKWSKNISKLKLLKFLYFLNIQGCPLVDSRQISPRVGLMLRMLDLVSLECLASLMSGKIWEVGKVIQESRPLKLIDLTLVKRLNTINCLKQYLSRCDYQNLHSMLFIQEIKKIVIKIIFRWCLNRYNLMISSRCYYKSLTGYG